MSNETNPPGLGSLLKTPGLTPPNAENIDQTTIAEFLNYAFRENGGPGYTSPLVNVLQGVRLIGPGNQLIPIPDDTIGLAWVTRPLLNLSDENVIKHPQLLPLYQPPQNSIQAYIKGLLDPVWGRANSPSLLDPYSAWITPITNLLKVSAGFPDISLNMGKSSPGFRKEVYQFVDGILKHNGDFDMRQTYHNAKPNFLPYMFETWLHYIEGVTLGDEGMEPYYMAMDQNYIDYDCRIYHMILNKNMRNIEGMFCNAGCVPTTFPSGAFSTIDRTQDTLRGQGQDEFEINFSSVGFRFGNMRLPDMFNRTTIFFNPSMHPSQRGGRYRKLAFEEYYNLSYRKGVYPWININTMELEFWGPIK